MIPIIVDAFAQDNRCDAAQMSMFEPLEPQVSDEELRRRSRSDEKTYTTAEVLAHLESL